MLAYKELGSGVPVVFLHPTPLDHQYWLPLIGELSGVRAIVPDLRGHGQSPLGGMPAGGFDLAPDAPVLSMAQHAQDVLELLDGVSLKNAVFAGCSIGGYVLLELWRQAPERMRAMAFVCSKPQADAPAARQKRAETIAKVRTEGVEALFDGQAQNLVGAATRESRPQVVAQVRAQMRSTAEAVVAIQAGLATRLDSLATVTTINVPVLAIAGGQDTAVSPTDMEAFSAAPGGCEMHVLDAGHFAAFEQPQRMAGLFSLWMERMDLGRE